MKLINKIIRLFSAGVLLALAPPSTGIAGTTGGPVYGGGGTGGGLGTCPAASGICEDATGNLVLNDAGAGIIATPAAATGSNIVLSEGSSLGPDAFTLGLGGTSLDRSVICTIGADGSINTFCPIFNNAFKIRTSLRNIVTAQDPGGDWIVETSPYRLSGSAGNSGYLAFGEVLTYAPGAEVIYDPPVLNTCTAAGITPPTAGCSGPIGISHVGVGASTDWSLTMTATITAGTSPGTGTGCIITMWEGNADDGTPDRQLIFPLSSTVDAEETLTVIVTTTATGGGSNYDYFGLFRGGNTCAGITAMDVTFTAEVIP